MLDLRNKKNQEKLKLWLKLLNQELLKRLKQSLKKKPQLKKVKLLKKEEKEKLRKNEQ
jgi:hypothetical protein